MSGTGHLVSFPGLGKSQALESIYRHCFGRLTQFLTAF